MTDPRSGPSSSDTGNGDGVDYIDDLPRLSPGATFRFRCHREVACFNACCSDLDLVLSPYDVLRLRRSLGISGDPLIQRFGRIEPAPRSGLPLVYLRMRDDERQSCPFVSAEGCTVYANRPGACRAYPLGRGTSMTPQGEISEQYVVVREEHCLGFAEPRACWSIASWVGDQGLTEYNTNNDRYLALVDRFGRMRDPVRRALAVPAVFALYQLDTFPTRIEREALFEKLAVSIPGRVEIMNDEVARLSFAIEWAEAIVDGRLEAGPRGG